MDERNCRQARLTRWLGMAALSLWLAACAPLPVTQQTGTCPVGGGEGDTSTQPCPVEEAAPVKPRKPARASKSASPQAPAESASSSPYELSAPRESDQQGLASWYGPRFHGRRTASGERFDSQGLTAAHRTLAFGTRVCVRSAITGKTVVVRINDRGPFAAGRVIDLSQGAAEELGMIGLGIKPVELWQLDDGEEECPELLEEGADDLLAAAPVAKEQQSARAVPRKKAAASKKRR